MLTSQELLEKLPNGRPRASDYKEFLRITGLKDTEDSFVAWTQVAVALIGEPAGRA